MIAEYLKAFFAGAALCMIGQVLIDKTRLTPARILTLYVVAGVLSYSLLLCPSENVRKMSECSAAAEHP